MSRFRSIVAVAFASGLVLAVPAEAHPHLLSSSPKDGSTVSNVNTVRLQFSEALVPAFSRAELTMTAMPGMRNHRPMKLPLHSLVLKDGHTMAIASQTKLQPGTYKLKWHAVSTDTHRVDGQVVFSVR